MPWEERTVSQMRKEFVERVLAQEKARARCAGNMGLVAPRETNGWLDI